MADKKTCQENDKRSSTEKLRALLDRRNQKIIAVSSVFIAVITSIVLMGVRYGELKTKIENLTEESIEKQQTIRELKENIRTFEKMNDSDHREILQSLAKIETTVQLLKERPFSSRRMLSEKKAQRLASRRGKSR